MVAGLHIACKPGPDQPQPSPWRGALKLEPAVRRTIIVAEITCQFTEATAKTPVDDVIIFHCNTLFYENYTAFTTAKDRPAALHIQALHHCQDF
jgi:hypothetical protein